MEDSHQPLAAPPFAVFFKSFSGVTKKGSQSEQYSMSTETAIDEDDLRYSKTVSIRANDKEIQEEFGIRSSDFFYYSVMIQCHDNNDKEDEGPEGKVVPRKAFSLQDSSTSRGNINRPLHKQKANRRKDI